MSNFKIVTSIAEFEQQLIKAVNKQVIPKVLRKVGNKAKPLVLPELEFAFQRTMVFRGMSGEFAGDQDRDVQAHLGLTDADAAEGAMDILSAIGDSEEALGYKVEGSKLTFVILISRLARNILDIPSGEYVSEQSQEVIPWIEWLLKGGETAAFIDFEIIDSIAAKPRPGRSIFDVSRSGRALMRSSDGGGWDIDDYSRFAERGKTFISDMLTDQVFVANTNEIINDLITTELQEFDGVVA